MIDRGRPVVLAGDDELRVVAIFAVYTNDVRALLAEIDGDNK